MLLPCDGLWTPSYGWIEMAPLCKGFADACTRMNSCEKNHSDELSVAFEGLAYVAAQSPELYLEAVRWNSRVSSFVTPISSRCLITIVQVATIRVEFYQPVKHYLRLVGAVQKVLEFRTEKLVRRTRRAVMMGCSYYATGRVPAGVQVERLQEGRRG